MVPAADPLPHPPFYFPLRHGRYDVAPGLNRFGKDFGAGGADEHIFQIDRTFDRFRVAKMAARAERFAAYAGSFELTPEIHGEVATFIARRLAREHPDLFRLEGDGGDVLLRGALTGESFAFDARGRLGEGAGGYADALDALACQVQEDLAIVSTAPGRGHWLSGMHVCLPNGWAPAEKLGKSFAAVHEPVAGMEEMNRRGEEFATIMTRAADGIVRFAWGVTFDDELNHHPDRPRAGFDASRPRAFLRVERQTIWGFPHRGAALFTIRPYLYDCADLRRDPATRDPLASALRTMPAASRAYKGLAEHADALADWLAAG